MLKDEKNKTIRVKGVLTLTSSSSCLEAEKVVLYKKSNSKARDQTLTDSGTCKSLLIKDEEHCM